MVRPLVPALVVLTGSLTLPVPAARAADAEPPQNVPPALAQFLRETPAEFLQRYDANKDGVVTRAEFDAATADGKIKLRHANMRGSAIVRMFDAADTNKDGRVSLEEAQQAALRQFDAADADHNGVLTPDERRQAAKATRKARLAS